MQVITSTTSKLQTLIKTLIETKSTYKYILFIKKFQTINTRRGYPEKLNNPYIETTPTIGQQNRQVCNKMSTFLVVGGKMKEGLRRKGVKDMINFNHF